MASVCQEGEINIFAFRKCISGGKLQCLNDDATEVCQESVAMPGIFG